MWEEFLMLAIGSGIWAVLSCILLAYLLKDAKKREAKYCTTIDNLADTLKVVGQIHEEIKTLGSRIDILTVSVKPAPQKQVKTVVLGTATRAKPQGRT